MIRLTNEILVQMDGVGKNQDNVLILAASNMPWSLDKGFRRRFQKRIYIPLPDKLARISLIKIHIGPSKHTLTEKDIDEIAEKTDGLSGADIAILTRNALMETVKKCKTSKHFKMVGNSYTPCLETDKDAIPITIKDIKDMIITPDVSKDEFMKSLENSKSTVSKNDILRFEQFTKQFGEDG